MNSSSILSDYYDEHREELVVFATKLLQGDRMTAEDAVQNTFLRLLTGCRLTTVVTLPALVYTTLRNQVNDVWRHRQAVRRLETQYQLYADDCSNDSFRRSSARQMVELLERRIGCMPVQTARVMRLSVLEQRPVSEIAELLDMKYKTAEFHLGTGRKQLRSYVRQLAAG